MSVRDWSNDSQSHTQICILESQIEIKTQQLDKLNVEIELLKRENERLHSLVDALHGIKENLNTGDTLDRFK